ncbi:MAG: SRPBCC family protein [Deltaproteobacteria bacterium]|nr:SRPBCC family protein [Deltaproteobacteria bacterium]
MAGATSSIEINAPIQKVYDVIVDFESYPEFLSETQEVEVVSEDSNMARVTFTVKVVKKIQYTLDISFDEPNGISWVLHKGQMMKSNEGGWKLTSKKKNLTLAEYEVNVGFGPLVPKSIANQLVGSTLPAMMKAFKERIEEG